MEKITLYQIRFCPYCAKVRKKLEEKGLKYEEVKVDSYDRSVVKQLSGQEAVPVIVIDGKVIADSEKICKYLDAHF